VALGGFQTKAICMLSDGTAGDTGLQEEETPFIKRKLRASWFKSQLHQVQGLSAFYYASHI
jgi:hypothetical protein